MSLSCRTARLLPQRFRNFWVWLSAVEFQITWLWMIGWRCGGAVSNRTFGNCAANAAGSVRDHAWDAQCHCLPLILHCLYALRMDRGVDKARNAGERHRAGEDVWGSAGNRDQSIGDREACKAPLPAPKQASQKRLSVVLRRLQNNAKINTYLRYNAKSVQGVSSQGGGLPTLLTAKKILDFQPLSRHIFVRSVYHSCRQIWKAKFPFWGILRTEYDALIESAYFLVHEVMD